MGKQRETNTSPVRATAGWLARHPRIDATALATGAGVWFVGYQALLIGAAATVVAGVSWRVLDRPSFDRLAGRLVRAWWRRWAVYQRQWHRILFACGLIQTSQKGTSQVPKVLSVRSTWCWDTVRVRMVKSQTAADYEAVLDRLADAYRCRRATVRQLKPGVLALDFQRHEPFDTLSVPLPALPESVDEVDLATLPIGVDEYGQDLNLNLIDGIHHLFGGATGAGKGSFLWGTLRQLAPLIREGLVRLWVIDPKGGMEFGQGQAMFHRYADTDHDGVALTREYVAHMDARKKRLGTAGVRKLTVSAENPMEILICDELAAMTEYADRDISREFEPLLSKALTQYRAVLGRVLGAVQEPTKDNVPMRGLFPTKIALRLDESSYVDMCLGEGVRDRGAFADQIPGYMPGIAYLKHEGKREPRRVRAAFTDDDDITELVAFCADGPAFAAPATVTPLTRTTKPTDDEDADEIEDIEFIDADDDDQEDIA
ncbi:cell division protein FtsK [Allosaccharopolyspora coralli]|uniref:Cell division protein FtsK n=1 Tax=Allosaccharopolyspora coralli TaxID=2665642 RepID=A0A5Q3Q6V0_9PSEU|nr:FtsK/SpoIIIE domain-containing protein [Allosaccharopolyspora coralli]QGK69156.1 cell division protein FtsK [Allosaccharopolyspora coralli]